MSVCPHCQCKLEELQGSKEPKPGGCYPAQLREDTAAAGCDPRWETAVHEAAHAVVAILSGGWIDRATILPGEGYRGIVQWRQPRLSVLLETRIVNALAGFAAGDLVSRGIDPTATAFRFVYDTEADKILEGIAQYRPEETCGSDACEAVRFIVERRPGVPPGSLRMDLIRAQEAVKAILGDRRIWAAVNDVAGALMEQQTCADADIRPIVLRAAGDISLISLMRQHRLPIRI